MKYKFYNDGEKSILKHEEKINISNPNEEKKYFHPKMRKSFLYTFFLLIFLLINFFIIWKIEVNNKQTNINSTVHETIHGVAKKAHDFVNNSSKGILIFPIPPSNISPKVSVVIPTYNCESTILRAIRSIQNQNFSEFEIILVNDFSTDKTSDIIENLRKEDNRIKIINNKKNMGILYTRCIGVLASQGKYIFPLDNDDMFLNKDVIDTIYNEINNGDFDIIYFKGISVYHLHDFLNKINLNKFRSFSSNKILYQPELGDYAIKRFVLWTQCIKSELYKKSINTYGEEKYSRYVTFFEDAIINYINNQLAKKAELLLKFGILHIDKPWTAAKRINQINKNKYELYFIEALFDFSRNSTEVKEIVGNKIINLLNYGNFLKSLKNNKNDEKLFNSLIEKILSSQYINNKNKELIKKKLGRKNN